MRILSALLETKVLATATAKKGENPCRFPNYVAEKVDTKPLPPAVGFAADTRQLPVLTGPRRKQTRPGPVLLTTSTGEASVLFPPSWASCCAGRSLNAVCLRPSVPVLHEWPGLHVVKTAGFSRCGFCKDSLVVTVMEGQAVEWIWGPRGLSSF